MIVDVQLRQEIQNRDIWLCDAQGNRYEVASGGASMPDAQGFETYTSLLSPMETLPDTLQLLLSTCLLYTSFNRSLYNTINGL